jgi:hypothetical protein
MTKTSATRQSNYRERRKADGWVQRLVWLSPDAQKVLANLPKGTTKEQFINDALTGHYQGK